MSRSNPNVSNNPCQRWFEWDGENGVVRYYDKDEKKMVNVEPFMFLVLDQLATIKGWDEGAGKGIFSNEVRDTTQQPLVVKWHGGGTMVEGFYRDIKDSVKVKGGNFTTSIYIAIKLDGELQIANLQLKGAALSSWLEFSKKNRKALDEQAVKFGEVISAQKGKISYKYPTFELHECGEETNVQAIELDRELQTYLDQYTKTPVKQVAEEEPSLDKPEPTGEATATPPQTGDMGPEVPPADTFIPPGDDYNDLPF